MYYSPKIREVRLEICVSEYPGLGKCIGEDIPANRIE